MPTITNTVTVQVGATPSNPTEPSDLHLKSFPRPVGDNGRGIHFALDLRQTNVDQYTALLKQANFKWTCVYGSDELTTCNAAKQLMTQAGVMSVIRVEARGDIPHSPASWAGYVKYAVKQGVVPYFVIGNEPEDGREGFGTPEKFANFWGPRAQAVVDSGGYAGLQCLSQEYLQAVCANMSVAVKDKLFFALHNYGANHPPQYPFPEHTTLEDDTTVLRFLAFAQWFRDSLGFIPPMIGCEGGWLFQNDDDNTYPPVHIEEWIDWHWQMFEQFHTGVLANGQALPDYLFTITPWLANASNWYSDSWWFGLQSTPVQQAQGESTVLFKQTLIDKFIAQMPFTRQFTGAME